MADQKFHVSTEYKAILKKIAQFLTKKQKTLLNRVLILTWPFFILFFVPVILQVISGGKNMDGDNYLLPFYLTFFVIWGTFCIIYISVSNSILFVERIIWIDSFFDEEHLSDEENSRIAKKIYFSVMKMRILLFLNYYVLGFIFYFGGTALLLYLAIIFEGSGPWGYAFILMFIFGLIPVWAYFYYVDIKLRYFWMVYLDQFEHNATSYFEIKKEMFKLNEISKGNAYKKILVMNFGIESTRIIANEVINLLTSFLRDLGNFGGALGTSIDFYSEQYLRQVSEIGKLFTKYMLYKHARSVLYEDEQIINSKLYSLKGDDV